MAETGVKAEKLPLDIVHEDASVLIVINKPPGLVVHPGAGNPRAHAGERAAAHDPRLARVPRAGLVHRLDKDTSGVLVVARTLAGAYRAGRTARRARDASPVPRRVVGAMVAGGTVDAPIGRHRAHRIRMAVRSDGREAVTHYRLAKRFRAHTSRACASKPAAPTRSACTWRT